MFSITQAFLQLRHRSLLYRPCAFAHAGQSRAQLRILWAQASPRQSRPFPICLRTRLLKRSLSVFFFLVAIAGCFTLVAPARAENPTFTVGWSVYAGWNPYFYMQKSGILKKWADKYGVTIKLQRFDYAASLDSFVAKNIAACTMTNMEALDMPAAAGVDSTVLIVGDYSNGNDQVLVRGNLSIATLPTQRIMLVQKTVSEYLLERA